MKLGKGKADYQAIKMMNNLIIVRGGGDIATGTIYKLYQCGFDVLVLETEYPSAIRRNVVRRKQSDT